jgi:hypothetical protein
LFSLLQMEHPRLIQLYARLQRADRKEVRKNAQDVLCFLIFRSYLPMSESGEVNSAVGFDSLIPANFL